MRIEFFQAPWCGSCKGTKPHVISACKDQGVEIEYIDASIDPDYCNQMRVTQLPTIIIYDGMREVDRIIGAVGKYEMAKRLQEAKSE